MAWQPGQSGNPGGRPKANPYMDKLLEEHALEAVNVILTAMRSDDEKMRVQAAKEVLDRKYGKPAQTIDHGNKDGEPFETLSRIERAIVDPSNPDA